MAKLLLIEDDPQIQKYLQALLAKHQYDVLVAADGLSGVNFAEDPTIKLLLVDLNLPGLPTGLDLIQTLRQKRPDCPIVVISGFLTPERLKTLERMGVSDFLTKPFEVDFVVQTISQLLKKQGVEG